MNRWTARIVGLIMLLIFLLLFANLQNKLAQMQKARGNQPATTTTR